ncbi:MAG: hypothetical protein KBS60_04125 [Phascolarctobacterium sp.]|nr:hypothetical protein [Candidatus Phascolarctobacterium caballi]
MTEFAKNIKIKLIQHGKSNAWLIEEVSKRTGLYFDRSYYSKIARGEIKNERIINCIDEIMGELEA